MDFIFINIAVVLIFLIVAAYYDLKTKSVPPVLLYSFVAVGLFFTIYNLSLLSGLIAYTTIIFACFFFIVGYLINRKNWLGGADVLLFTAIILMTPVKFITFPFYLSFFLVSCICGLAFYGIMFLFKKQDKMIKFVPCLLVGYIIAVIVFL